MNKDTQTPEPFYVQMVSDQYMEHCDKYPHLSIQKVIQDGDRLKLANRVDWFPPTFKTQAIETLPELKQCASCKNDFPIDTDFFQVGALIGNHTCIRCYERINLPDRKKYETIKKKQLLAQLMNDPQQQLIKVIDVKGELVEFYREAVKGDYLQALEKYTNRICKSNAPSDAAEFNNWFNNQGYVCWWHKKQKKFMYTMEGVMIELFKRSITVEQLYVEFQKHKDVAGTIKKQSNETT